MDEFDAVLNKISQLRPPRKFTNSAGHEIFGFSAPEFARAAAYYASETQKLNTNSAKTWLNDLSIAIQVERYSYFLYDALFGAPIVEHVRTRFPNFVLRDRRTVALALYADFLGEDIGDVEDKLNNAEQTVKDLWGACVPDEENVTEEQLTKFYDGIPFPMGVHLHLIAEHALGAAIRGTSVAIAREIKAQKAFDLGGNVGMITSALAQAGVPSVTLIEPSTQALAFARWRDEIAGISNVRYCSNHDPEAVLEQIGGPCDFGVCIEVLEHVLDVEGVLETLNKCIRPGGVLFLSSSFGLPMVSHLVRNRRYSGQERALFEKCGFYFVKPNLPLPMIGNMNYFIKR